MIRPNFEHAMASASPFIHFRASGVIAPDVVDAVIDWLDGPAPLSLRTADFYEQHELSLIDRDLPEAVAPLVSVTFVGDVAAALSSNLGGPPLELVDVCVHRLRPGQTIRIHNDYIGDSETHRLVIQLNRGWQVEQGGLLMLFADDDPESVTDVILPVSGSGFGFQISHRSHHAVSTIREGNRDSLVYTFRPAA